jgi:hypothetical protein
MVHDGSTAFAATIRHPSEPLFGWGTPIGTLTYLVGKEREGFPYSGAIAVCVFHTSGVYLVMNTVVSLFQDCRSTPVGESPLFRWGCDLS